MFTGIIRYTGIIRSVMTLGEGKRFLIEQENLCSKLKAGDSIAVNGACQTVEKTDPMDQCFQIYSFPETLMATNFSDFREGVMVNLEPALALGEMMSGHMVQGHVESTGLVRSVSIGKEYADICVLYSSDCILKKGSICIDGISLTVQEYKDNVVRVQIIPETLNRTNIRQWKKNDRVNIETDYLVQVVKHLLEKSRSLTDNAF